MIDKHLQALMTTKVNIAMQMTNIQLEIMEEFRRLATTESGEIQETLVINGEVYYQGVDY